MVNGFFILSGFLVSLWIHRVPQMDVSDFFHRKLRKLVPMFMVALFLGFLINAYMAWKHPGDVYSIFPGKTYFDWGNFNLVNFVKYYNVPLWYMVIEFAFILTVPFLYYLSRTSWGIWIAFVGSAIFAAFLFSEIEYGAPFASGLYYSPFARFWQFMAGVLVARILMYGKWLDPDPKSRFRHQVLSYTLFALFLVATFVLMIVKQESDIHWWNYTFHFDLLTTLFYMVLIPLLYLQPCVLSRKIGRGLRWCSDMTYPVYLVHVPAYTISLRTLQKFWGAGSNCVAALLAFCLTLLMAGLMLYGQKRYFSARM